MEFIELIDDLIAYIENASNLPLSNKGVIDKVEVVETLKEIKSKVPEELNKAKWILKERERILKEAKHEAEGMLSNSEKQLMRLIDEHEITKSARTKAQETLKELQLKKTEVNNSIKEYVGGMLKDIESNLEGHLSKIKENIREIEKNKK